MTKRNKDRNDENSIQGIPIVPEPSREFLNDRQLVAYRTHREEFIEWMLLRGKDPEQYEGYAHASADRRASMTDKWFRWVWTEKNDNCYTIGVTHTDAMEYVKFIALQDYSDSYTSNIQKSLKCYFRFTGNEWDPDVHFRENSSATAPKDYFTMDERQQLREAALEYGSVPSYLTLQADERPKWTRLLARRFGVPQEDIDVSHFKRANGFKVPSMVWASLDAGLRPIEVGNATTEWVDVENAVLRIPKDESSKVSENFVVSLRNDTADLLGEWLDERELYPRYDGTDGLWRTRNGQPYGSSSLKYLLNRLTEVVDIRSEKSVTWYMIRHSTATYMAREEDLAAAQAQLRHTSIKTTAKYDQTPPEDRRDALDRM